MNIVVLSDHFNKTVKRMKLDKEAAEVVVQIDLTVLCDNLHKVLYV